MKKKKTLRNSAKAVIIQDGKLLVIQKKDRDDCYCVLPGGGQKKSETLPEALKREALEEIGAKIKVGPLLHVREYFSENHGFALADRELHQIDFFFACRLTEDYEPKNGSQPDSRQRKVKWIRLDQLDKANFYPRCLLAVLKHPEKSQAAVYLGDCN